MVAKKILDLSDPTINIRISGDVEKYSTLQIAMKSLIAELEDIKNGFIDKEVDKLHLLLRVTDQLWTLVINKLCGTKDYNDMIRKAIVDEMDHIGVKFQFWEDHNTKTWAYTPLIGFVQGLYHPIDVTLYIHVLIYHVLE
ncbi:hypothetical protein F8M41_014776 [Gigaspora margarita]|uniref:Uncharacterized protein n=1 Tax=Gigaspora margarita TaxID=4874 RepID=A0A8H3WW96_GIGMA|nr:hypothetical protein F8M41_014776 [Gigaspora margarita]